MELSTLLIVLSLFVAGAIALCGLIAQKRCREAYDRALEHLLNRLETVHEKR